MAELTGATKAVVRSKMRRAIARIDGADAANRRPDITEGEFDNHFDGAVSAIFHIADAVELARTGVARRFGEGEQATVIRSVLGTLAASGIPDVPSATRLIDLNSRRNTSVHGHWTETLDSDALDGAISAARIFHVAASAYLERLGVSLGREA
jgi:hypothetical protein